MPIELPPTRSPSPASDRPITDKEKEKGSKTKNEHTNITTSSGLRFPENPIFIDIDCEKGDIEPELRSD
jgi:hypothetical protein